MHLIVKMFIYRVFYLFIVGSSAIAAGSKRAMTTVFGRASKLLFIVAFFIPVGFLIRQVYSFCSTGISVMLFIKSEAFPDGLIMTKVFGMQAMMFWSTQAFSALLEL